MRIELFDFQKNAVKKLLESINIMQHNYSEFGKLSAVSLTAPTGSGKTIICASVIESLFSGNTEIPNFQHDPLACVIWLTDSPSLNKQTLKRFADASDHLDSTVMEIIDQNFAKSHKTLSAGKVYFLNRQLLGKDKVLSKPNEGGRTFYDVLNNTIEDPRVHLYLFLDEAHRGLGKTDDTKTTSQAINKTVYSTIIDGQEGINKPIPCVIGISATPDNFNRAMNGRKNRGREPDVVIPVPEVKETGLIKDSIEIRIPDLNSKIRDIDLEVACKRYKEIAQTWADYCARNEIKTVIPLMIIQVEDKVTEDVLHDLCWKILSTLPSLNPNYRTCFANVFGEKKNITAKDIPVPYYNPEDISDNTDIKFVFAKDAITTGWDCPRAEILYSRRRRSDETYIAQLIGRMIRTPLVKTLDVEVLNSVSCYLPEFDPDSVSNVIQSLNSDSIPIEEDEVFVNPARVGFYEDQRKIIDEEIAKIQKEIENITNQNIVIPKNTLKNIETQSNNTETNDIDQISISRGSDYNQDTNNTSETSNPDNNSNLEALREELEKYKSKLKTILEPSPDKIKQSFESIITRLVKRSSKINEFENLWICVELSKQISSAEINIEDEFYRKVESLIVEFGQQFQTSLTDIENTKITVTRIDPLTKEVILNDNGDIELIRNNENGIRELYRKSVSVVSQNDIIKEYINKFKSEHNVTDFEAIKRITAVTGTLEIVGGLQKWAIEKAKELVDKYDPDSFQLKSEDKEQWETIKGNVNPYIEKNLSLDTNFKNQEKAGEAYQNHIFCDENGLAYFKFNNTEQKVLKTELSKPLTVGWYRNMPKNLNYSLSIAYSKGDDNYVNMYPDFIFFCKVGNDIKPAIVDPHGHWLGDSIAKLKGYVDYLEKHPDIFCKVLYVSDLSSNMYKYLDLKNEKTQKMIKEFKGENCLKIFELCGINYG